MKQDLKKDLGFDRSESAPKDLGKSRIAFDKWVDESFLQDDTLINISSGVEADKEGCVELLYAEEIGQSYLK